MTTVGGSFSWNATCDVCGFQFKSHELKKRWDGLIVCDKDFEVRHPMDFYRVKDDTHILPFTRQDPVDYIAEYEGILDNYIDSMAVPVAGSSSSNIWGNGFNTLVAGEVVGIKFYLDFENGKYKDTIDGINPFRVVLQRLHDWPSNNDGISAPTILGLWDFYPPFKHGWNYRLLPKRVTLDKYRTYILARSWDNTNATGVVSNYAGNFHLFEPNPYLQYGTNVNNFAGGSAITTSPAYQASALVPLDILFIPSSTIVDNDAGIFDHAFGTNWNKENGTYSLGLKFSDNMRSVAGIIQVNCNIIGLRFLPVDNFGSVRPMLWDGATGFVEADFGGNVVAIPNMWNYLALPIPIAAEPNDVWVASIHNEGGGNTLAEFNYVYAVGSAEAANSRVSYFANYYRATYGYPAPNSATLEETDFPYLIDFVTEDLVL